MQVSRNLRKNINSKVHTYSCFKKQIQSLRNANMLNLLENAPPPKKEEFTNLFKLYDDFKLYRSISTKMVINLIFTYCGHHAMFIQIFLSLCFRN